MNKNQLASRIWNTANKMRSKIDTSEYKDYILGFIFYKFLSQQEEDFLKSKGWDDEDIAELTEEDTDSVEFIKSNKGYFIAYKDLFNTWLKKGSDFDISDVSDALSAFKRNIDDDYKQVFNDIFKALETGLSNLGDTQPKRTKAVADILELINPIPMDGKQGYDVLGFIYEYLLMQFATNAGKKAGQFYTPHEVAMIMSDIVAYNLKEADEIDIYDPTSGSASLLLTIGQSVARKQGDPNSIHYYAQELIGATYNLTRMNLVMRGVSPSNISTRNNDTLGDDWPLEGDSDKPLLVNACVSNPPYSQPWTYPESADARFDGYGYAPKSKADYAFLLHNLYHLDRNGVMCIVLPHGVLFRGGEEANIRKKLIEDGNIEAVIGLPPNIFYGTGIPTIIMVLKKIRDKRDILFIDASKGFVKDGKKNRLRARDIKRIVDTYEKHDDQEGYSRLVGYEEIEANDFNLNIPRYVVDDTGDTVDLYATVYGGIPSSEIDGYGNYWEALPGLREEIFEEANDYGHLRVDSIADTISKQKSTEAWKTLYREAYKGFEEALDEYLFEDLLHNYEPALRERIGNEVLERSAEVALVDEYDAYQTFDRHWQTVAEDMEALAADGMDALRAVDRNMVLKKKDDKEVEEQDKKEPWVGRVLPFWLIESEHFANEAAEVSRLQQQMSSGEAELEAILQDMTQEELEGNYCNETGDAWVLKEVPAALDEQLRLLNKDCEVLTGYLEMLDDGADRDAQLEFIAKHNDIDWDAISAKKDGTYTKTNINKRLKELREEAEIEEGSLAAKLRRANEVNENMKAIKKEFKKKSEELQLVIKADIESIGDEEAIRLLRLKWIDNLSVQLNEVPESIIKTLANELNALANKYEITLQDVSQQLEEQEESFIEQIGQLIGQERDMAAIEGLLQLFGSDR